MAENRSEELDLIATQLLHLSSIILRSRDTEFEDGHCTEDERSFTSEHRVHPSFVGDSVDGSGQPRRISKDAENPILENATGVEENDGAPMSPPPPPPPHWSVDWDDVAEKLNSICSEGPALAREAILKSPQTLDAIVKVLLEGTDTAAEGTLLALWQLCSQEYGGGDEYSSERALSLQDVDRTRVAEEICALLSSMYVKQPSERLERIQLPVPKSPEEKKPRANLLARASKALMSPSRSKLEQSQTNSTKVSSDLASLSTSIPCDASSSMSIALATCDNMLEAVVFGVHDATKQMQEYVAGILWCIAARRQARAILVRSEPVLAAISYLLMHGHGGAQERAVGAVWALSLSDDSKRIVLASTNIRSLLIPLKEGPISALADAALFRLGYFIEAQPPGASFPTARKGKEVYLTCLPPRVIGAWENEQVVQLPERGRGSIIFTIEDPGSDNVRVVIGTKTAVAAANGLIASVSGDDCTPNDGSVAGNGTDADASASSLASPILGGKSSVHTCAYTLVLHDRSRKSGAEHTIRRMVGSDSLGPMSLIARCASDSATESIAGQYWFSVDNISGLVMAGRGAQPPRNVFLIGLDRSPLQDVRYVGFANWETPLEIRQVRVMPPPKRSLRTAIALGACSWASSLNPATAGMGALLEVWGRESVAAWANASVSSVPTSSTSASSGSSGERIITRGVKCEVTLVQSGNGSRTLIARDCRNFDATRPLSEWLEQAKSCRCAVRMIVRDTKTASALATVVSEILFDEMPMLRANRASPICGIIIQAEVAKGPNGKSANMDLTGFIEAVRPIAPHTTLAVGWTTDEGCTGGYTDKMVDELLKRAAEYRSLALSFVFRAEGAAASPAVIQRVVDSIPPHWSVTLTSPIRLHNDVERYAYRAFPITRAFVDFDVPSPLLQGEAAVASLQGGSNTRADSNAMFLRALETGPRVGSNLVAYARFLATASADFSAVEALCVRAMEFDPSSGAELTDMLPSIVAQTSSASTFHRYAIFLATVKQDAAGAEEYCLRAIEAEPSYCDALLFFVSVVSKWDGSGAPLEEGNLQYRGVVALVSALPGVDMRVRRQLVPYIASWKSVPTTGRALEKEITVAALSTLLGRVKAAEMASQPSATRGGDQPLTKSKAVAAAVDPLASIVRGALAHLALLGEGMKLSIVEILEACLEVSLCLSSGASSPSETPVHVASSPYRRTSVSSTISQPAEQSVASRIAWLQSRASRVSADVAVVKREFDSLARTLRELAPRLLIRSARLEGSKETASLRIADSKMPSRIDCRAAEELVMYLREDPAALALILRQSGFLGAGGGEGRGSRRARESLARCIILSLFGGSSDLSGRSSLLVGLHAILRMEYADCKQDDLFRADAGAACTFSACLLNTLLRTSQEMLEFATGVLSEAAAVALLSASKSKCACHSSMLAAAHTIAAGVVHKLRSRSGSMPSTIKWILGVLAAEDIPRSSRRRLIFDAFFLWISHYLLHLEHILGSEIVPMWTRQRLQALIHSLRRILFLAFDEAGLFFLLESIGEENRGLILIYESQTRHDEARTQTPTPLAFFAGSLWDLVCVAAEFIESTLPGLGVDHKSPSIATGLQSPTSGGMHATSRFREHLANPTLRTALCIGAVMYPAIYTTASPLPPMFGLSADEVVLVVTGDIGFDVAPPHHTSRQLLTAARLFQQLLLNPAFDWSWNPCRGDLKIDQIARHMLTERAGRDGDSDVALALVSVLHKAGGNPDEEIFSLVEADIAARELQRATLHQVLPILTRRALMVQAILPSIMFQNEEEEITLLQATPVLVSAESSLRRLALPLPCSCTFDFMSLHLDLCKACESCISHARGTFLALQASSLNAPPSLLLQALVQRLFPMLCRSGAADKVFAQKLLKLGETATTTSPAIADKHIVPTVWGAAHRALTPLVDAVSVGTGLSRSGHYQSAGGDATRVRRQTPRNLLRALTQFVRLLRRGMSLAADEDPDVAHDIVVFNLCIADVAHSILPALRFAFLAHLIETGVGNSGEVLHAWMEQHSLFSLFLDLHYTVSLNPLDQPRPEADDELVFCLRHVEPVLIPQVLSCAARLRPTAAVESLANSSAMSPLTPPPPSLPHVTASPSSMDSTPPPPPPFSPPSASLPLSPPSTDIGKVSSQGVIATDAWWELPCVIYSDSSEWDAGIGYLAVALVSHADAAQGDTTLTRALLTGHATELAALSVPRLVGFCTRCLTHCDGISSWNQPRAVRGLCVALHEIATRINAGEKNSAAVSEEAIQQGLIPLLRRLVVMEWGRQPSQSDDGHDRKSIEEQMRNVVAMERQTAILACITSLSLHSNEIHKSTMRNLLNLLPLSSAPLHRLVKNLAGQSNARDEVLQTLLLTTHVVKGGQIDSLVWARTSREGRKEEALKAILQRVETASAMHRLVFAGNQFRVDCGGSSMIVNVVKTSAGEFGLVTPETVVIVEDTTQGVSSPPMTPLSPSRSLSSSSTENGDSSSSDMIEWIGSAVCAVAPILQKQCLDVFCGEAIIPAAIAAHFVDCERFGSNGLFGAVIAVADRRVFCACHTTDNVDITLDETAIYSLQLQPGQEVRIGRLRRHPTFASRLMLRIVPQLSPAALAAVSTNSAKSVEQSVRRVLLSPLQCRTAENVPSAIKTSLLGAKAVRDLSRMLASAMWNCPIIIPIQLPMLQQLLTQGISSYWEEASRTNGEGFDDDLLLHATMSEHLLYNRPSLLEKKMEKAMEEPRYGMLATSIAALQTQPSPLLCVKLKDEVKMRSMMLPMRQSDVLRCRGTVFPWVAGREELPPDPNPKWIGVRGEDIAAVWPRAEGLLQYVPSRVFRALLLLAGGMIEVPPILPPNGTRHPSAWGEAAIFGPISCADIDFVIVGQNDPEQAIRRLCEAHGITVVARHDRDAAVATV